MVLSITYLWRIREAPITERPSTIEMHGVKRDLNMLKKWLMLVGTFTKEFYGPWDVHSRDCVFLDTGYRPYLLKMSEAIMRISNFFISPRYL